MAIPDSPNPSGCDTIELYISSRREPHLSGGDYPQKKHGKAVYTHNGRNGCLQASHRLPCPALPVSSINRRPQKSEIRWLGIRELYQPNRKKSIYPHHLKNSINSFYPSSGKKKRRRNEPDQETYVRAARCASQEARSFLVREISQRHRTCNRGRPGPIIR